MGNADTKLHFRKAVLQLTTKTQPILGSDEAFWNQFWGDHVSSVSDVFVLLPASEVRALRESAPSNLATLCYKAVERLVNAADAGAATHQEQQAVLNCVRILTRVLPYIFEDPDWRGFFWSSLPSEEGGEGGGVGVEESSVPLAHSLINALCDLLFCPDFTVTSTKKNGPDAHEDLQTLDSCEFIWEAGVGAAHAPPHNPSHDSNRKEILKLILTCCSQIIYEGEGEGAGGGVQQGGGPSTPCPVNPWLSLFTSFSNRHALPLFTSLLNTVCGYDPVGRGLPYNHLLFTDTRECLVEACLQLLITALDCQEGAPDDEVSSVPDNLFINYLSRIHREEDFGFVLQGFTRLLNNPLQQTYLPHSTRRVACHQELLVFFWKFCDYNKKFLFYVLKSSEVLDVLVPILYHLNEARADQSRVGLLHIGVFILLLLSGERNFGVRLNKPYTAAVPMDVPVFTGSHADLMVLVFHKIITTGHQRLQPLFDCLLTILVNVSPYIKSLSMVGANKLLHLLEAFCTPWFLFSAPHHHHLVFFLLETFNNIIQYQFDGNSNLVYTIIRKRQVFHALASLPCDGPAITRALTSRRGGVLGGKKALPSSPPDTSKSGGRKKSEIESPSSPSASDVTVAPTTQSHKAEEDAASQLGDDDPNKLAPSEVEGSDAAASVQGSNAQEAPPGTQTCTLAALPRLDKMTEQASGHPSPHQLSHLTSQGTAPYTHDLITAVSPHGGETGPLAPSVDAPLASATDITSSFSDPRPSPSRKEGDRATKAPSMGGMPYPPSPHLSTKVQPPSHPHQELSYQQQRRQGQDRLPGSARPLQLQRGPSVGSASSCGRQTPLLQRCDSAASSVPGPWTPSAAWVSDWKSKLPLQTIMRLLQVLVPQVEKICIDKGLTDESEILRFLQHGTLVGLLPVPHPILIRKYQANAATAAWFRTYAWGVIYLRNVDPPIWYDTDVKLFEIQRV